MSFPKLTVVDENNCRLLEEICREAIPPGIKVSGPATAWRGDTNIQLSHKQTTVCLIMREDRIWLPADPMNHSSGDIQIATFLSSPHFIEELRSGILAYFKRYYEVKVKNIQKRLKINQKWLEEVNSLIQA